MTKIFVNYSLRLNILKCPFVIENRIAFLYTALQIRIEKVLDLITKYYKQCIHVLISQAVDNAEYGQRK